MRSINSKQFRDQMRTHYNHVSKCDDHHRPQDIQNYGCFCSDYSVFIQNIDNRLLNIENNISNINNYLRLIMNKLENDYTTSGTDTEEQVMLSLSLPQGGTRSISPNTVAFDSLLADVDKWNRNELDIFYRDYISPVVSKNDGNLLSPISVSDLCSCTKIPVGNRDSITWAELDDDNFMETKRAYIMQFILANRSNATRAMYLTNKLIGAFALPL